MNRNSQLDRHAPNVQELSTAKIVGLVGANDMMPQPPGQQIDNSESPFSPQYVLGLLRRQRTLIALLLALIGIPLILLVFSLKDRYVALTLIALDQTREQLVGTAVGQLPSVDTEVEIMTSSSILQEVAIQLVGKKEKGSVVKKPKVSDVAGDGEKTGKSVSKTSQLSPALLTSTILRLRKQVNIHRRGLTSIISIAATAGSAQEAAHLSRLYTSVYLQQQVKSKLLSLEYAEKALRQRVEDLRKMLERSDAELAVRELHKNYIARLRAIKQKQQIVSPHARVVSLAIVPGQPSFPKRTMLLVLSIFAAIGTAIGVAFIKDVNFSGVRTASELESITGVWNIGMVPCEQAASGQWGQKVHDWVVDRPTSDYSRAIQQLWFAVNQRQQQDGSAETSHGSIMMTAMGHACGHDVIALSVARIAALSGQKVVIVDGGHHPASLGDLMGLKNDKGLGDLERNPSLDDLLKTIQNDGVTDLRVLTSGKQEQGKKGGFAYPMVLGSIVARLEEEFDLVIIVGPSLSQKDTGSLYAVEAGLTLVIVEAEAFKVDEISTALQRLHRTRDANIVTAMTRKA